MGKKWNFLGTETQILERGKELERKAFLKPGKGTGKERFPFPGQGKGKERFQVVENCVQDNVSMF